MASGLPVVSTSCGGQSTAVIEGLNGFLTPCGDAEALACAMLTLVTRPQMRRVMGDASRRIALERFSIAAAGRPYLEKYDETLASRGA